MNAMGIDIGTTTVSVVLLDEDSGAVVAQRTAEHRSFIDDGCPVGKVQDPERMRALALGAADAMIDVHGAPACIGLTGQMHGMLYVDNNGCAVSPLYTWQDGRAGLSVGGGPCAVEALKSAGCAAAAGYGLATHLHLLRSGQVPRDAAKLTTISDYIGMGLTGAAAPRISADMAASWGAFDLERRRFMAERLEALGVDPSPLPGVCRGYEIVGETAGGVPVVASPGDNQASVLGAARNPEDTLLVNIGTGSQVSLGCKGFVECSGSLELRPFGAEGYLLAGSGLCGGRAYALLEGFYREVAGADAPLYDRMLAQAQAFIGEYGPDAAWHVRTAFSGTRDDPAARGAISGIGVDNFRPGALTVGVIAGILEELRAAYEGMKTLAGRAAGRMVGSGNGLRRNPLMRRLAEALFGLPLSIPAHREEAAYGAALCALVACGRKPSMDAAQRLIRYENDVPFPERGAKN